MRISLQTGNEKNGNSLVKFYFEQTIAEIKKNNHRFLHRIARAFKKISILMVIFLNEKCHNDEVARPPICDNDLNP